MTITAKYAATCPCCHGPIRPGDKIEWSKGSKARHTACAPSAGTPIATYVGKVTQADMIASRRSSRGRGRWTGCSCGSREDSYGDLIPSDRNCASCEHDA